MATFTSTTDGNINDGGTYGNTSPGVAGTDYPDTDDICVVGGSTTVTLNVDFEVYALKITGTIAGGGNTITVNGATSNKPFDNDGTITGDLNVIITNTGVQQDGLLLDAMGTSGNINNLTLNLANGTTANKTIGIASSTTLDNTLTITSGVFDTTFDGGASQGLSIGGHLFGNGTFIANDSTVTIAGQCTVANVELTAGSITSNDDYRPSGGSGTTIDGNGSVTATGASQLGGTWDIGASNTPTLTAGRLHSTLTINTGKQGQSTVMLALNEPQTTGPARHVFFYNLTLDSEGTENNKYTMQGAITCTGDLTITDGEIDTGSDHALTVTGDVSVTGTLTGNASAISMGSLTIESGATYSATSGTTTIVGQPSGDYMLRNKDGGTFTHNNGTLTISRSSASGAKYVKFGEDVYYNLIIDETNTSGTSVLYIVGVLNVANDLTITDGELGAYGGTGAVDVDGNVLISSGGILDLKDPTISPAASFGSLTIESGGEYDATSGTTTCKGAVDVQSSGTFTHNDGTFLWENTTGASITGFGAGAPAFYNLEISSSTSNDIFPEWDFTVRNVFDINGQNLWIHPSSRDVTITMGFSDATAVSTGATTAGLKTGGWIESTLKAYQNHLNDIKLYGASQLYLAQLSDAWITFSHTSQADCTWYLKNFNILSAFDTTHTAKAGSNAIIMLDGDCEFAAVTVSSGDKLDLNGQRAEFSGNLSNQSTGDGNGIDYDGMLYFTGSGRMDSDGASTNLDKLTVVQQGTSTTDADLASDGTIKTFFYNQPSVTQKNHRGAIQTIVGAGTWTCGSGETPDFTDLTVATGGTLDGSSSTLTVAGDFCIGGGLIGRSAYDFNGAASGGGYINCTANAVLEDIFDGGGTVEAWIRIDGDAGTASGMRPFSKDKWFVSVDNDASGDVYKLRLYQFFSGDNGVWSSTNTVLSKDKWHHIAITYNNGATTNDPIMYVDGKQVAITESSTPTGTFDADGSDELYLGNREDGARTFNGVIGMARLFDDIRTVGELRTDMFNAYADMSSTHLLKAMYQFDEGTSTALENVANAGTADGTITANSSAWATMGDSNFTYGTSTLDLTGTGDFVLTNGSNFKVYNLTMAAASKTTTLIHMAGSSMNVYGTHTVGAGTYTTAGTPSVTYQGGGTVSDGGAGFVANYITYWSSTASVPAAKFRFFISDQAPTNLGGDMVCEGPSGNLGSAYFRGGGYTTNTNNYQVTTPKWVFDASTTMNIGSSTMILNSTDGLSTSSATSVLSAGPGCKISGTNAATTFKSQNDWSVVGTIENLNVTNEELNVTGKVINCTGEIHQWHNTIDSAQQLDRDTADDRDINLGRDLDKNTELVG